MIDLEITADDSTAQRMLSHVGDQLPFAISKALNDTARVAQDDVRKGIQERFILRTPASTRYLLSSVLFASSEHATKQNLQATLRIGPQRPLLARFERGGTRTVRDAFVAPFAIPTRAIRPAFSATVSRRLLPKNLGLLPYAVGGGKPTFHARGKKRSAGVHITATGKPQLKGKERTFVLQLTPGARDWGVFQRIGPKRTDIRLIWAYRQQITIRPLLKFEQTIRASVARNWEAVFAADLEYAIATAR